MKNVNNRQKKLVVPKPAFQKQNLRLLRQLAQKKERLMPPLPPTPDRKPAEDSDSAEGNSE